MYSNKEKNILLDQAKSSIQYGLKQQRLQIDESLFSDNLNEIRACFVTLNVENRLRGCIGSLNAKKPLIIDVSDNAYSAAFEDPRFPKLTNNEFLNISIEISILSVPEKIIFTNEKDLLRQLRIGIDGLIFECRQYRATYLPTVWSSLQSPNDFLNSLKEKSGLKSNYWSDDIICYRYTTELLD